MTDVLVDTAQGTVRGSRAGGLTVFAGIPFAASPVGDLRLRPPQPVEPWSGVRDALTFPPAPAQGTMGVEATEGRSASPPRPAGDLPAHFFRHMAAGAASAKSSAEDCLYLNVWSPEGATSAPVIVYIYGGGFEAGSASPPITDGAALARATGCVVVTVNYRVGALGFLHLSDLGGAAWAGSTNLGLQDQAAALRWVQQNITAFGGDKDRVTAAGESAGAFSIGSLLTMPLARGTFQRAILHSGSTQRVFPAATATAIAHDLLTALRLDDVEGLLTVPTQRILDVQKSVIDTDIGRRNLPGGRSWGVVLDGTVLPRHPHDAVADGEARDIVLLVGANRDEIRIFQRVFGDAFRPEDEGALVAEISRAGFDRPQELLDAYRRRLTGSAAGDLAELRAAFLTDQIYRVPAYQLAEAQIAAGGVAHTFLFADAPFGPGLGAFHACDDIYTFDKLESAGVTSPESRAVGEAFRESWGQFAATGNPGWPQYDPDADDNTRQFGGDEYVTEPLKDQVSVLRRESRTLPPNR
jgi:para-nitrobenzyl esterase